MRRQILAAIILFAAPGAFAAPVLTVPADLSAADPAPIRVEGLAPLGPVTIRVARRSGLTRTYVAEATYTADESGVVDLSRRAPDTGSYAGVNPLGLFWSAKARTAEAEDPGIDGVSITVTKGTLRLADAATRSLPDPRTFTVSTDTPFPGGIWAVPTAPGRHPVIIVLGGSEGGASTARAFAPLFAARGYATLGLPYYNPGYDPSDRVPGLPDHFVEIPVDRLAEVRAWLLTKSAADVDRIGLWGASKGAEYALIAATRFPWVRAVAAIVPTDVVWEGWGVPGPARSSFSFGGRPLPFQPYAGMNAELTKAARGQAMDLRKVHIAGRISHPERLESSRIPIELFGGALLVAGGGKDVEWPSAEMALNIAAQRPSANGPTTVLIYPEAGHGLAGPGTTPSGDLATLGGTPSALAEARAEVWAATFRLFQTSLKP